MNDIQRFIFIASTKEASVNGEKYKIDIDKIEPENLRAIQWYGNVDSPWGELEFDGEANRQFFDFSLIQALYEKWVNAKNTAEEEYQEYLKLQEIEDGKYQNLRVREYPTLTEQVASMMKIVSKLVEDEHAFKLIDGAELEEFKELVKRIQDIKEKYPDSENKKDVTKTPSKKKSK